MNRKGMSQIITTVIMVVLVLVAVGIVWSVIQGIIGESAGQAEIASKCTTLGVEITKFECTGSDCNLILSRTGTSSESGIGFKIVFMSDTESTPVIDSVDLGYTEGISPGGTVVYGGNTLNDLGFANPTSVRVTTYYMEGDEEILCPNAVVKEA